MDLLYLYRRKGHRTPKVIKLLPKRSDVNHRVTGMTHLSPEDSDGKDRSDRVDISGSFPDNPWLHLPHGFGTVDIQT
jgi:hypothetical protein